MRTTTTEARRQVWKYALPSSSIHTETIIRLPATHKIVHVGYDPKDGSVALWIEVPVISDDPDASLNGANAAAQDLWSAASDQSFRVIPTGSDLPANTTRHSRRSAVDGSYIEPLEPCATDCLYCDRPHSQADHRPSSVGQGKGGWAHIGTAIDINWGHVWHVYQKK